MDLTEAEDIKKWQEYTEKLYKKDLHDPDKWMLDLVKKIRDAKGTFHAKMGTIKDRNCMDLTEAEDIKKWQEYKEELYKKIFTTQITMMV